MLFFKTLDPNQYPHFMVYFLRVKYQEKKALNKPPTISIKKNNTSEYMVRGFYKLI